MTQQYRYSATLEDVLKDVELRAPLPPEHCPDNSSAETQVPRSLLCRMYVACNVLQVGHETRFTALVLLHRYCLNASVKEWVGAACLFLACKGEDEPRRIRDVINVAHMLQFAEDDDKSTVENKDDKITTISVLADPPVLDESYWHAKANVVATEQAVLRVLQFDVLVSHPHRLVVLLAEEISSEFTLIKVAWRRLNDALFSTRALQCGALPLACAAMGLAIEETQQQQNNDNDDNSLTDLVKTLGLVQHWSQTYGVQEERLQEAKKNLMEALESS